MTCNRFASRLFTAATALAAVLATPTGVAAQERPADLTELPPVPTDYTPDKTSWGDYNFSHTYQIEYLNNARILFQRPKVFGNRVWVNDEEFARRVAAAERSDSNFAPASENGVGTPGTEGLADWIKNSSFGHRTSMLVSPADGQLPPLTPQAEALYKAGRSGWVPLQEYDWVDDFDSWDRCISRGYPASMYPFRYNNGIRIFQSPGYVVINLEMLGTRVIPIGDQPHWPGEVEAWMGNSRGHWEGKTLVIETTNIKSGDSVTHDIYARAAAPLNMATQHVPPFNTIPTSAKAKTVERLTMTGPNTLVHELTYSDPEVFTQPWTTRIEWIRDDDYNFFEYACHEGNVQVRNYITASRAHREQIAGGAAAPTIEGDDRSRFANQFDYDPAANDRPAPPGPPPAAAAQPARSGAR
ncbi:hypothetical protein KK137_15875 [Croceibacterium sp. LX-88]|jgi:hypothetical protein|uniref:Uncharacterized protein n=1 Tax=Croceibacterium selenioxidans TaxID=2838833 RepID=A0ABS5W8Z8_9SPHN|nr:hypothetical protein [Croceibacterium selenioxidans]MBT2135817.1 hypothetical protein [Croceibacterium selenioxidans]